MTIKQSVGSIDIQYIVITRGFRSRNKILKDAIIGIPDPGEPYYGEIGGVVYCAEDAVLPDSIVPTVLDWKDKEVFCPEGIKRAIG